MLEITINMAISDDIRLSWSIIIATVFKQENLRIFNFGTATVLIKTFFIRHLPASLIEFLN